MEEKTIWIQILSMLHELNRRVKEPGWNYQDQQEIYQLKDSILKELLLSPPQSLDIQCYYIPYLLYCEKTKDKAGALMRSDPFRKPFEHYLALVPPCEDDRDVPSKATIEVVIRCDSVSFSFHQPIAWYRAVRDDADRLEKKPWINAGDFNHSLFLKYRDSIETLMGMLREQ